MGLPLVLELYFQQHSFNSLYNIVLIFMREWYECSRWRSNICLPYDKIDNQSVSLLTIHTFQDCPGPFQDYQGAFQNPPGAFLALQNCWGGWWSCNRRLLHMHHPSVAADLGCSLVNRRRRGPWKSWITNVFLWTFPNIAQIAPHTHVCTFSFTPYTFFKVDF